MEDLIFELEDILFELCSEIISTPFFMFKARWQLTSKIKQIKDIIKLAKQIKKETEVPINPPKEQNPKL